MVDIYRIYSQQSHILREHKARNLSANIHNSTNKRLLRYEENDSQN